MEEYKAVDNFMEKMREVFIHELSVIPSRIKDSKGIVDYRFEYLMDPDELPEVGTTPKDVIYKDNKMQLFRYKSKTPKKHKTPLLFVYALINRSYILDLQPGNSFVEYWLDLGHDVYLIDWGEPSDEDRYLELDTLIDVYLKNSVDIILDTTGATEVNLFGWCIGGSLAIIYAGLYPEKVKNLILLTTPFDSEKGGLISLWADESVFHLDKIIEVYGNMPSKLIRYGVITMYPFIEFKKNIIFYDNMHNKFFMQAYALAEKWINDNLDVPGQAFKKYIKDCFQTGNLKENKMVINGKIVKMSSLTMPILNIAAEGDHIVPNESTAALKKYVPTKDYTFLHIQGGHVGLAYDPRSRVMWPQIAEWINSRTDPL